MVLLTTENQSYGTMVWTSLRPGSAINPAWPILLNVCDQVVSDYVNEYQLLATAHQGQYPWHVFSLHSQAWDYNAVFTRLSNAYDSRDILGKLSTATPAEKFDTATPAEKKPSIGTSLRVSENSSKSHDLEAKLHHGYNHLPCNTSLPKKGNGLTNCDEQVNSKQYRGAARLYTNTFDFYLTHSEALLKWKRNSKFPLT